MVHRFLRPTICSSAFGSVFRFSFNSFNWMAPYSKPNDGQLTDRVVVWYISEISTDGSLARSNVSFLCFRGLLTSDQLSNEVFHKSVRLIFKHHQRPRCRFFVNIVAGSEWNRDTHFQFKYLSTIHSPMCMSFYFLLLLISCDLCLACVTCSL